MRKFKGLIKTSKIGSESHFEFDVEDDATDEEIEEVAREAAFERVDWWFEEVKS